MASPNAAQRIGGRIGDRFLSGTSNYNPRTGQWRNVVPGAIGTAAKYLISAFAGPAVGALAGKGISKLVDRYGNDPQFVQPESIPIPGYTSPSPWDNAVTAPSPAQIATPNLGFPSQSPGGTWAGYLQGQGSVNNFGNSQFGNGMATVPGNWSPASTWGQGIQEGQGSNLNFGNYSPGATAAGGGVGRGGSAGANRAMQTGSFRPSSGMDSGGARGSFLEKINRRGLNIN